MRQRASFPTTAILLFFALVSRLPIAAAADLPDSRRLRVLTSFLPVHSLALSIAGDRATVENWLPPGVDPHEFQFSPRDLRRLADARLLLIAGLGLEGWNLDNLRSLSGNPDLRIVAASDGLGPEQILQESSGHDPHHEHDGHETTVPSGGTTNPRDAPNPHFWLDPLLMAHAATNLQRALAAMDPAGAELYAANTARAVSRLNTLDEECRRTLARCTNSAFITFHNAFPYLARRYGLRLVGVVEAGVADSTPRELAVLAQTVRRENVRTLFVDGTPTRLARRLAADWKLKLASLETLETGQLGASAYEDGMRRNLAALRSALEPPPP